MKFFRRPEYYLVPDEDEERPSTSLDKDFPRPAHHGAGVSKPRLRERIRASLLRPRLSIFGLLSWLALWTPIIWLLSTAAKSPTLRACLERTEVYCMSLLDWMLQPANVFEAPAFEAVELYDTDFANEFTSRNIYRGPPTPEREDAWRDLWDSMAYAYMTFLNQGSH